MDRSITSPRGSSSSTLGDRLIGYCATFQISGDRGLEAPYLGGDHRGRLRLAARSGRGLPLRHGGLRRSRLPGLPHRPAALQRAQEALPGVAAQGDRLRRPAAHLHRRLKKGQTVEEYVELVQQRKLRDPVLSFQLRNGFEILGVIPDYLPSDRESLGYGVHLVWKNPNVPQDEERPRKKTYGGRLPDTVRVATVQYEQRRVRSFEEFAELVEYFVDVVADYKADFVVFPRALYLATAFDRGPGTFAAGLDRGADQVHAPVQGRHARHGRPVQREHHRRLAPDADVQRPGREHLPRLPPRRLDPRAAEDPPDPQRGLLVEHRGGQRPARSSTPTAGRSA